MQQINLFTYVKLPIKSPLDARFLLELYGSFLALLMIIFTITYFVGIHANSTVIDSKAKLDAKRTELIALAQLYPQSGIPVQILNATKLPICNIKFSDYLQAFAKAYVAGIWLTDISITNNGQDVSLKGHALHALEVQQYLLELKQQALFNKLSFDIKELNDQTPPISFEMTGRIASHG